MVTFKIDGGKKEALSVLRRWRGAREARYKKLGGKKSMSKVLGNNATHQNTMEWNPVIVFPFTIQRDLKTILLKINLPKNDQIELIIFIGSCNKPESPLNTAKH